MKYLYSFRSIVTLGGMVVDKANKDTKCCILKMC